MCMKHHYGILPHHFSINVMPELNLSQLDNKISRISLDHMYNYKLDPNVSCSSIKSNCVKNWNSLPFHIKCLPYISCKHTLFKNFKKTSTK